MKESRKILIYGLLGSILLIILCLYLHRGEFINNFDNDALNSGEENISIAQVLKEYDTEKNKVETNHSEKSLILLDRTKIASQNIEKVQKVAQEESSSSKTSVGEDNETIENNVSEEIEEMVDENLPPLDNFPIFDNGSLKDEENSTIIETNSNKDKPINLMQKRISNIIKSDRIHFYKNRAKITNKGKKTLDKVIEILKDIPDANITVKGYTDASGRRKMNQWISSERAKSVKKYLVSQGVAPDNIETQGFGENELLYTDKPYSSLNRRVEIEIKRK